MQLLEGLIQHFLAAQQQRLSANTLRAYRYDLDLFARQWVNHPVQDITIQQLRAFLNATSDLAPSTLARRQAALRAFFGWAFQEGYLTSDPTVRLESIRLPERVPRPLTIEQVEAILATIPMANRRNRLLFTLLVETGMRVGEALNIHAEDVRLNETDGGYIRIVGKGDRERVVPLIDAPRSLRLLRSMLRHKPLGPLFSGSVQKGGHPGEPMDYTTVFYHFEQYVERAKKQQPALFAQEGEAITIHRLRHTYATQKLREGVSLPAVRKLLGHRSLQTTLRYADTDLEMIKRELVEARRRRDR